MGRRDHFIETRVVSGDEYLTENVEWADAVFSVGGDGTFLMAAAKVTGQKPVIGFNSDPEGSEGHLCLTGKSFHSVSEVISDLFKGKFSWIRRQRIRVTLLKVVNDERLSSESDDNENGRQINNGSFRAYNPGVPLLALNDVFMGEIHAARVSSYDVQIDNNPVIRQKSSGLTVSTGTGSTAWYYTINRLSAQDVGEILSIVNSMGLMNIEVNDQQNKEISERFSQNLLFDPSSPEMAFAIREPVYNKTFKEIPPRGFAKRIFLKSRCSDGQLVLDGSITVPFNEGSEVLLEIFNEDALLSAIQA
ncbi:unnamed protein product [Dracunculus medinensis]|uniref:NAD(+) kinase n=1 Tax=Dracunculus medinensis TaxID=318479 RepID=A0A0N4UP94_DRAME|nr:unnamed protein product [Dracunculus medinensis]